MVQKIVNYFGADGLLHILCSALLTSALNLFAPLWAAAFLALIIGACKELIWDKCMGKGTPEWKDFFADLAGIALGCL